jgi:hypothetical protein
MLRSWLRFLEIAGEWSPRPKGAPTKTLRESMLALTGFHGLEVYGITVSARPRLAVEK